MIHTVEIVLLPEDAEEVLKIKAAIHQALSASGNSTYDFTYRIKRKSLDARKFQAVYRMLIEVAVGEELPDYSFHLVSTSLKKHTIIVGAGPAGLFAALKCLELGVKPIILERGKDVKNRRRDLAQITRMLTINPDSNYCFGEGGAGTYSDGKLYTRSSKRGSIERILNIFVKFGADAKILYEAHPHIGTNKLPQIIQNIRNYIIEHGGEVHFESRLVDIIIKENKITSVVTLDGKEFQTQAVILATGHSARDIFELLDRKNIFIEAKPFALGVRVEHPQVIIDAQQYKCKTRGPFLPPATYSLVEQVKGRGVFSFCMCPGGIIAPAATAPGEVVVNGWSPSKRNNPFANSGLVVSVGVEDFEPYKQMGALSGLAYQKSVEQACFIKAHHSIQAPAQRITDFINNKLSTSLPDNSYLPGLSSIEMKEVLPKEIHSRLKEGMLLIGKKMKGFLSEEAIMVATESRTSSPVKIPRNKEDFQHPQIEGLFPCGEGAGYAGGIVSAAMDGEKTAEFVGSFLASL